MQNETQETTTAAAFGRSSVARLPPELREAVDAAIADGATIDEIAALIRGEGGACSRSAVGRYTKNVRDLIRRQQETDRGIEMWVRALGERAEGRAGLILIETLRTMTLAAPWPISASARSRRRRKSSPAWRWFSSASRAPTSSASSGSRRRPRQRRKGRARRGAGAGPGTAQEGPLARGRRRHPRGRRGETRPPRRAVTSAPVDPWNPAESHLIPLNPGESRPENVSEASSFISLNGGRSLRSLAYAPFGAARSRALRTCGPAAVRNSPPKARGAPCHVMAGPARTGSGYPAIHTAAHP